jgi:tripartite-type tricarboxylate transporter receptor subunit TctC
MPYAGTGRRAVLALAAGGLAAPALAQGKFPDRPIRLIVPWPPGGSADAQLRSIAELSSKALGQPVLVENRAGASGTLGAQFITSQAKPDGYALTQMHLSVVRRAFIVRTPPWDPVADFSHIIGLCGWMYGIAVKADGPIKSWADFLAYARANPGRLTLSDRLSKAFLPILGSVSHPQRLPGSSASRSRLLDFMHILDQFDWSAASVGNGKQHT